MVTLLLDHVVSLGPVAHPLDRHPHQLFQAAHIGLIFIGIHWHDVCVCVYRCDAVCVYPSQHTSLTAHLPLSLPHLAVGWQVFKALRLRNVFRPARHYLVAHGDLRVLLQVCLLR